MSEKASPGSTPAAKSTVQQQPQQVNEAATIQSQSKQSEDDFSANACLPIKKPNHTLEIVKSKLKRHLSYEKDTDHQKQSSPPSSPEEVARRAELRRFRAKRIQEELHDEQNKSGSTHTSRSSKYASASIDIGLPGHGPRDGIEFSIDASDYLLAPCPSPARGPNGSRLVSQHLAIRRWSSCPAAIGAEQQKTAGVLANLSRSTSAHESVPHPTTRPSSLMQCSEYHTVNKPPSARIRLDQSSRDTPYGSDVWLAAQRLQPRAGHVTELQGSVSFKSAPALHRTSPVGGSRANKTINIPSAVWNHCDSQRRVSVPSGESGRLASHKTSKRSFRNPSRQGSFVISTSMKRKNTSSSSGGRVALSVTPGGISSSYYPSGMPSVEPSPSRSNSLVNVLSMRDLQNLELSPFKCEKTNLKAAVVAR